jgi:hypothetical protein
MKNENIFLLFHGRITSASLDVKNLHFDEKDFSVPGLIKINLKVGF